MRVSEFNVKVLLLKDLDLEEVGEKIGNLLDEVLGKDKEWIEKNHYKKEYKPYIYNWLYPLSKNKFYKKGVYDFQIRSLSENVNAILENNLKDFKNDYFKVLIFEKKEIRKRPIERVYSITPLIMKNDLGYWKKEKEIGFFESRLKANLIKKYNYLTGNTIKEAKIYNRLSLDNKYPIGIKYKNIKLLGDKVTLYIEDDDLSQEIIYLSLAMGLLENNTRLGAGYINYQYRR
ncbi:MAG: hypothetical protein ACTJGH_04330 [Peptoniphilaceae bacterium]